MKRNREDCESIQENKRAKTDKSTKISDLCKLIEQLNMAEISTMEVNQTQLSEKIFTILCKYLYQCQNL